MSFVHFAIYFISWASGILASVVNETDSPIGLLSVTSTAYICPLQIWKGPPERSLRGQAKGMNSHDPVLKRGSTDSSYLP